MNVSLAHVPSKNSIYAPEFENELVLILMHLYNSKLNND